MTPEPRTRAGTSSTTCDAGAGSPGRARGPWGAVDADKLRDALARLAASTRGSPPTPATGFGAFVRGELDRSPEQELGFAAMGKFLKCDPMSREIESLRKEVSELKPCGPPLDGSWSWASADLKRKIDAVNWSTIEEPRSIEERLSAVEVEIRRPKRGRRKNKYGGRGVKKDDDYWLGRWRDDVAREVKKAGYQPNEFHDEMIARVYSVASGPAAKQINDRYRCLNGGKNLVSSSSLRRRERLSGAGAPLKKPATDPKKPKSKGPYKNKLWAEWECYRTGRYLRGTPPHGESEFPPAGEERLGRNSAEHEQADDARAEGVMTIHEGGRGLLHLPPPADEADARQDDLARLADDFLKPRGIDPHAVHASEKNEKERRGDGEGNREAPTDQLAAS